MSLAHLARAGRVPTIRAPPHAVQLPTLLAANTPAHGPMALSAARIGIGSRGNVHFISENAMRPGAHVDLVRGIDLIPGADRVLGDQIETCPPADRQLGWQQGP